MIAATHPFPSLQFRLPLFPLDTRRLRLQLNRMMYGDALVSGNWSVEYVCIGCQHPFFGVVWRGVIMGVVIVTTPLKLPDACDWLARFLIAQGWRVETGEFKPLGAVTWWPEPNSELKQLWNTSPWSVSKKSRKKKAQTRRRKA